MSHHSIEAVLPSALLAQEFARNVWTTTVPASIDRTDLTDGRLWTSTAARFRVTDLVDVMPDDGSWYARLIVRAIERTSVTMGVLQVVDFIEAAPGSALADFEIRWRNPSRRFGVFRKADGGLLHDGFTTKAEAAAWAAEQEDALSAA